MIRIYSKVVKTHRLENSNLSLISRNIDRVENCQIISQCYKDSHQVTFSHYFELFAHIHEYNTRQYIGLYAVPMKTDWGLTCISHRASVI